MKKPRSYKLGLMTKRSLYGWMFILPFLIGLIFFVISPLYTALVYSFNTQVAVTSDVIGIQGIGWAAYKYALSDQMTFLTKLLDSVKNVFVEVPCILIFSFLMANILNQSFKGRTFARAILFMPVITSAGVAASMLGTGSLDSAQLDTVGSQTMNIAGNIQQTIGGTFGNFIGSAFDELGTILNLSGVPILIFLAGLQTISPSIFESSKVEGATGWENFWKITFPIISPMILVNAVYSMIDVMCNMNNPVLSYLYSFDATGQYAMSKIMAMSWLYFLVTALLVSIVAGIISKLVYYEN